MDPAAVRRTGSTSSSERRIDWVDYAKGIGIVLVVFGHVWGGLRQASVYIPPATFHFVDSFIYSFHMPLFFFLSGLFIERSASRETSTFITTKLRTIVYPYVLWSILHGAFQA